MEDKGFDLALRAFAALASRHPQARIVIAGDGPERAVLATLAHALGIAERVDILGWVHPDGVAALIDAATIVVIPSRREPAGLVPLEAALRGRPVTDPSVSLDAALVALSGRVRLREGCNRTAEDIVTELWEAVFGRRASEGGDGEGKGGAPTGATTSR